MSKTHRKHEPTHQQLARDSRSRTPSRKQRMHEALRLQEQQSRGVEFPEPEVAPPKPQW